MRFARRSRFRAWHVARHNYMFAFSAALLMLAGAASLGAFHDDQPSLRLDRRVIAVAPRYTDAPMAPSRPVASPRLVMTYYIVDTQEMMDSLNSIKSELRHREWLERNAFEVMLVRNGAEQVEAQRAIDDARVRCVCAEFHVQDLRLPTSP
jgi:hypothetical protein